jgi:hypothetical protein
MKQLHSLPQSYCFEHCRGSANDLGYVWRIQGCTRLGDRMEKSAAGRAEAISQASR